MHISDSVYVQLIGVLFTLASVAFFTWLCSPFIRIILESTPRIVTETTRVSKPVLFDITSTIKEWFHPLAASSENDEGTADITVEDTFEDLILTTEIKQCIIDLAHSIRNSRKKNKIRPSRHVILHGPEGVGKSMAAKKIATMANMDYAQVCGRRVFSTGDEAVSQIQTLFCWAKLSSKGMLLFIDEAEAFLESTGSSSSSLMDDDCTNKEPDALGAFLYNLSKLRKDIILIIGTQW